MNYPGLVLCLTMVSSLVWAQPCCTGSNPQGVGLLAPNQNGMTALEWTTNFANGSFDRDGRYRAISTSHAIDSITRLVGTGRFWNDEFQLSVQLPIHSQYRELSGLPSQLHTGLGDVWAGVRYALYKPPFDRSETVQLSLIHAFAQVVLPTGRTIEDASPNALGADVMGEGVLGFGLGIRTVVRFLDFATTRLSFQYQERNPVSIDLTVGNLVTARWFVDYSVNTRWSVGAGLNYRQVFTPDSKAGEAVRYGSRRLRLVGLAAYELTVPFWTVDMALAWDPPMSTLSSNLPYAGWSSTLGLRRAFL
jgi:hypothetical protein